MVFLTEEAINKLNSWPKYKHRTRRICLQNGDIKETKQKIITKYGTPTIKNADLVFAGYQNKQNPDTRSLNTDLSGSFGKTLYRMVKGEREDNNERRRQITFHSFRRFVKTTISTLGMQIISLQHIGEKRVEKAEIFRKIEPHLTFLNVHQLRQGADILSKVNELEDENHP